MFLNQDQVLGELIPDVYISKITLETGGAQQANSFQENNPHIDTSITPSIVKDPVYGTKNIYLPSKSDFSKKSINQSEKLIITLDLVVKEKLDNGLIGTWFQNQDFSKYINIKILQSTKPEVSQAITENRNIIPLVDIAKTVIFTNHDLEQAEQTLLDALQVSDFNTAHKLLLDSLTVKDLSIKHDVIGDTVNLAKHNTEVDAAGNTITNFSFRVTFAIANQNPQHLAYFAFTYLNLQKMAQDYNMQLDYNLFSEPIGKIASDIAIDQSSIIDATYYFLDENGNIWSGPIDQSDPTTFFGISSDGKHVPLIRNEIGNSKVQDFRIFNNIQKLNLDFSFLQNSVLVDKLQNPFKNTLDFSIPQTFFTDCFLSADKFGNARFFFGIDLRKMLESKSQYAAIFNKQETAAIAISNSVILSMKFFRRRIKGSPEIGSAPMMNQLFDPYNQFDELIVQSGEKSFQNFIAINNEQGSIKEILSLSTNGPKNSNIRYFTGVDKGMSSITDGYYVYGVELEVEDAAFDFLSTQLNRIRDARIQLNNYFQEASTVSTTTFIEAFTSPYIDFPSKQRADIHEQVIGNFDPVVNRFTQNFIEEQRKKFANAETNPWRNAVITYLDILRMFTDSSIMDVSSLEKGLFYMVHPATGNPSGILELLNLMKTLEQTISDEIGADVSDNMSANALTKQMFLNISPSTSKSASGKAVAGIKSFTFSKTFDGIFNSFNQPHTGYDYLDLDNISDQIDGLLTLSGDDYTTRVEREVNHYFVKQNNVNPNINISVKDQTYTQNDSIESNHFSFLSPARIQLKDQFNILRIGNSPTPILDTEQLSVMFFSILNRNFKPIATKPPVVDLKSPIPATTQQNQQLTLHYFASLNVVPVLDSTKLITPITNITVEKSVPRVPAIVDKIVDDKSVCKLDVQSNIDPNHVTLLMSVARRLTPNINILTLSKNLRFPSFDNVSQTNSTPSIANFDITSTNSNINRLIQKPELIQSHQFFLGTPHTTTLSDALSSLPMQIKALYLSKTNPTIIRKNWFSSVTDPLKTSAGNTEFTLSYKLLNSVQIFMGFETNEHNDNLIKKPIWQPLTVELYNNAIGDAILCRMKPYTNKIIGITRDKNLDLPVFNEYFLLKATKKVAQPVTPITQVPILNKILSNKVVENTSYIVPTALQSSKQTVLTQKQITYNLNSTDNVPIEEISKQTNDPKVNQIIINLSPHVPNPISKTNLEYEDEILMGLKNEYISNNTVISPYKGTKV